MQTYVLGLGAAVCFGVAAVVQQRVAFRAPPDNVLRLSLLLWLARRPGWLLGVGLALVAYLLSARALTQGALALVEPLQVCQLLFALPLAAFWAHHRVPRRDWTAAVATAGGLAVFLVAANPQQEDLHAATGLGWILTATIVGGLALGAAWGTGRLDPAQRAPLLAAGAGVLSAFQAALTGSAGRLVSTEGLSAVLVSWRPWTVVAVALASALLLQSAYEMAPLPASLPASVGSEPLAAVAIGVGLLGGQVRLTPLALVGQVLGLAVMTVGVRLLATSPLVTGQISRLEARQAEGRLSRLEDEIHRDLRRLREDLRGSRRTGLAGRSLRRTRRRLRHDVDRVSGELARVSDERHRLDGWVATPVTAEQESGVRRADRERPDQLGQPDQLGDDAVPVEELATALHALDARAEALRAQADKLSQDARIVLVFDDRS